MRTSATPTAPSNDIAGVCNAARNVVGLMPHPEHAVDLLIGSPDGLGLFESAARVGVAACVGPPAWRTPSRSA